MTREQLEKMFDEEIKSITMDYDDNWNPLLYNPNNTLKQFIFETIIPEVLKSVIEDENLSNLNDSERMLYKWYKRNIKKIVSVRAKELYNINL